MMPITRAQCLTITRPKPWRLESALWREVRQRLVGALLAFLLGAAVLGCAGGPPVQGPQRPGVVAQVWTVVWPHLRAALPELLELLLGGRDGGTGEETREDGEM